MLYVSRFATVLSVVFHFLLWSHYCSAATALSVPARPGHSLELPSKETWPQNLQSRSILGNTGESKSNSVSLYSRGQKNKRRIYLAIYHRFELSVGNDRKRLGHSAFHWAILISPKKQSGKDTDAFDATDTLMVNQTGEILNPGRPFRLQVKKGVDPSRARSLLGRILIGTLDNDMSDENIESLFSRVPMPNKFADPPESCVNWALCAIMHLQIFGEVARFDRRLFSDWVLDYADRQLSRYQGEAMMEVATYGAEQENEQRDRDRVQSELQAIDWASVDIPEESRPNVAMGLLTPEECSRALVALVALWGSKLPGGKRMAMIEARQGAIDDSCRRLAAEIAKPGVCIVKPNPRPLAEILWVMINDIDGENPGDLYGSITITDNLGPQTMYNVEKGNAVSVRPREHLILSRSRPIAADGDFVIDLNLWDYDADASPNDEVSRGQISWKASDTNNEYDRAMQREIKGAYGKATVDYVVMRNAIKAVVQVILVDGDGENPADVFGKVSVSSRFVQRDLFQKEGDDSIEVYPGKAIPLSGATMAIPLDDTLTIHVDLWDYDSDWSPNDQIAISSATFDPQGSGTEKKLLQGEYGKVEVSVTWEGDQHKGC